MKRLFKLQIICLGLLLLTSPVWASPFLVSDPSPQAVGLSFEVREGTTVLYTGKNQPDGSIKVDISNIAVGSHTLTARYITADPLWSTPVSPDSVPLVFVRPSSAGGQVKGVKLVP